MKPLLLVLAGALSAVPACALTDVDAARHLLERERFPDALLAAERAIKAAPDDPSAQDVFGQALTANGRATESVAVLQKLTGSAPANAAYATHLGDAWYQQYQDGLVRWAKVRGDNDMLGTVMNSVPGEEAGGNLRYYPENVPVPSTVDRSYFLMRTSNEWIPPRYNAGLSLMPTLRRPFARMTPYERYQHEQPARQALVAYDRALAIDSASLPARLGRAECLFGLGDFRESGAEFEKVAVARKTDFSPWTRAAEAFTLGDDGRGAIRAWEAGIEVEPLYGGAYKELTRLYARENRQDWKSGYYEAMTRLLQNKPKDALKLLAPVTGGHPEYAPGWRATGSAQLALKDTEKALAGLQKAVDVAPSDSLSHYQLGVAQMAVGNTDAARKSLTRAAELRPDYPRVWFALANLEEAAGDVDSAIAYAERSVEHRPSWAEANENLGALLLRRGRAEDGVWYLERYLQLRPNAPDKKEVQDVIAQVKKKS